MGSSRHRIVAKGFALSVFDAPTEFVIFHFARWGKRAKRLWTSNHIPFLVSLAGHDAELFETFSQVLIMWHQIISHSVVKLINFVSMKDAVEIRTKVDTGMFSGRWIVTFIRGLEATQRVTRMWRWERSQLLLVRDDGLRILVEKLIITSTSQFSISDRKTHYCGPRVKGWKRNVKRKGFMDN